MQIKKYSLGELKTNCYLVFDEDTKEGLIIDPADDANFLSEQILQQGIILKYLVATHGHFDHILAASELQLAFNVPFFINEKDLFLVRRIQSTARHYLKREIIEKTPTEIKFLTDKVGPCQVITTPGHSPGSVCLYLEKNQVIFTGDTLFGRGTLGRTDFSYGSKENLKASIAKLTQLPSETIIYPGHEEISTLEETFSKILFILPP